MQSTPPPNEDLSDWLKEAGKRRFSWQSGYVEVPAAAPMAVPVAPEPLRSPAVRTTGKWVAISAVAAVAYLQYFYADVLLQIATSPSIIFLVLVHGQLPPL